ncbi:hypothetical protein [Burkholderia ubonensis]|uniref:hypothetical protein n=1 Tax=Burkholderia ubonensis TaxID=101571 RepID=UPI001160AE11|nr:hypothetical protein [Burkholderia ubonensis]
MNSDKATAGGRPPAHDPAVRTAGDAATLSAEERLASLEREIEKPKPSLEARLSALEKRLPATKDGWDKLGIFVSPFATILTGVVVALVSYCLTGRITNALERQKLQEVNITAMRDTLIKLNSADVSQTEAEASALALAAYGEYSVVPFITVLDSGGDVRGPAAMHGLRAAALVSHEAVCDRLAQVLDNRTQLYRWQTHRTTITLIGEIGCKGKAATTALNNYSDLVGCARTQSELTAYQNVVSAESVPTQESIDLLCKALDRARQLIQR